MKALEFLQSAAAPVSATQLAAALNCEPSSALRLLRTLVASNYAIRDDATKLYCPGPKALLPLSLYHPINEFRRDVTVTIGSLREETHLSVAAVLFMQRVRIVVDIVYGSERLSPFYETHLTRPIHSSATGKIFLWSLPPQDWPTVLGDEPFANLAPNTRTRASDLRADIESTRERGYARTCDESVIGLSGVAAPIRDKTNGIIGCIGAFGLTRGLASSDKLDDLGRRTKAAADLFSQLVPSVEDVARLSGRRTGPGGD